MNPSKTLLIVDDDDDLRETLAEQFGQQERFSVRAAATAAAALETAQAERIDLVILDIELPDMDGREVCRRLRADGLKAPVVMLTGQAADADQVAGLEAGANDYVVKPFKFAVLLARVRAHLRSHEHSEDATFRIGPYDFRPAMKLLLAEGGRKIRLTEKEANILKYLYRAGGKPVAREELLGEVWGYNPAVTTHTLETHVYRLRQKIEPDPAAARILVTEAGGYRLQA
ncbi:MAG: response regulator transcription factor [Maricaulaceae bacterium]|nr:response regulator transcription factor [Maricaulaceae bacterium]